MLLVSDLQKKNPVHLQILSQLGKKMDVTENDRFSIGEDTKPHLNIASIPQEPLTKSNCVLF